jgi:oligopeptide/dipeptide ABC transporter ATP-binding protein
MALLSVRDLTTVYRTPKGDALALDALTFDLEQGEMLGLIGESGCGKTTAGFSILRAVKYPGAMLAGSVVLDGTDLAALDAEALRRHLWKDIAMIPQCAMNALNPSYRVGAQIAEAILTHEPLFPKAGVDARVGDLMESVGLNAGWARTFPHKLSGGMKQRVVIAMALSCNPKVIIADESTTGLDVLVQAQIMALLRTIQVERNLGIILISHDLPMVADVCDRIGIMYAGSLVEVGSTKEIEEDPIHPYTKALLASQIRLEDLHSVVRPIEGNVPNLVRNDPGCRFRTRCASASSRCDDEKPALIKAGGAHFYACHNAGAGSQEKNDA